MKRRKVSDGRRAQVFAMTAGACYYCGFAAEHVEHVIPYAYSADNSTGNLVPSCSVCNSIAGSKVFASLQEKKDYIVDQRSSLHWRRKLSRMVRTTVTQFIEAPKMKAVKTERKRDATASKAKRGTSPRKAKRPQWRKHKKATAVVDNSIFSEVRTKALPGIKSGRVVRYGYVLLKNKEKYLSIARRLDPYEFCEYVVKTKMLDMTNENAEFAAQVASLVAAKKRNRKAKRDLRRINEQGTLGTHQPQDVAAHDRAAGSAAGADRGLGREPGAA